MKLWGELGRQIGLFLGAITLADVLAGRVVGRAAQPERLDQLVGVREPA